MLNYTLTSDELNYSLFTDAEIVVDILDTIVQGSAPEYTGEYEVTPSEETQILNCAGLQMSEDVIVHPIPTNYGRITWNGSTLKIS